MDNSLDVIHQLGKRIAYLRKQRKMSSLSLSLEADISLTYLSDLEHGRRNPSIKILDRVAKALGISLETLFKGIDDV